MRGDSDLESEPMFALLLRLFTNLWRNQRGITPFINHSMGFDSTFGTIKDVCLLKRHFPEHVNIQFIVRVFQEAYLAEVLYLVLSFILGSILIIPMLGKII